ADAVLLIVSILEPSRLAELLAAAKGLGLATLGGGPPAPGPDPAPPPGRRPSCINNPDLATFETRITTTLELMPLIPPGPIVVSESGFFTAADVRRGGSAGAPPVLVGEGLVRAADIPAKLRELTLVDC